MGYEGKKHLPMIGDRVMQGSSLKRAKSMGEKRRVEMESGGAEALTGGQERIALKIEETGQRKKEK